ncbi:MAG: aldose 1-epimerase [Planctomycetaceae bacterium]|nr:aldose 1-epimerase [Planctomycetaceae bacterium]
MEPIILRDTASGATAKIAPELGFNCFEYTVPIDDETVSVIDAAPDFLEGNQSPSGHGIPILFPYPNRIRGGKFTWDGKEYFLPPEKVSYNKDNAIHGFCLDRPWQVSDQGENYAVGEFLLSREAPDRRELWPADFRLEVRYSVEDTTLRTDIRVTNPDKVPLPWGFGTHPYFKLPLGGESDPARCLIEAPATAHWELIDCLPTGAKKPIPPEIDLRQGAYFDVLKIDDVLTGLPRGPEPIRCTIWDESAGLQLEQISDSVFQELVVYVPPGRAAVCLEPYTCVTDAINLETQDFKTGWQVLPPGETWESQIAIRVGRIIV